MDPLDLLSQDLSTGAGPPGGRYKNAVVMLCSGSGKGVEAGGGQGGGHAM